MASWPWPAIGARPGTSSGHRPLHPGSARTSISTSLWITGAGRGPTTLRALRSIQQGELIGVSPDDEWGVARNSLTTGLRVQEANLLAI